MRKVPEDVVIPRWYCPLAGRTFSLLPDCAAARLPSSLADVDRVAAVAAASPSLEAAADVLRPDITLPAGVRWIRRRIDGVRKFLHAFVGLFPDLFIGASTPLAASRLAAATAGQPVFVFLRQVGEHFLPRLSSSVGFAPRRRCTSSVPLPQQHNMGPDERAQSG